MMSRGGGRLLQPSPSSSSAHMQRSPSAGPSPSPWKRPLLPSVRSSEHSESADSGFDAVTDVLFSPSDDLQGFAYESPPAALSRGADDVSGSRSRGLAEQIHRLGFDRDLTCELKGLELEWIVECLPVKPLITGVWISGGTYHRLAHSVGSLPGEAVPRQVIQAIIDDIHEAWEKPSTGEVLGPSSSSSSRHRVIQLQSLLHRRSLSQLVAKLPQGVTTCIAAPLVVSNGQKGILEATIGVTAMFCGCDVPDEARYMKASEQLSRLSRLALEAAQLKYRRIKGQRNQEELIRLSRLTQGYRNDKRSLFEHESSQEDTGDGAKEVFAEVARSIIRSMEARSAIILDVTGFKLGRPSETSEVTNLFGAIKLSDDERMAPACSQAAGQQPLSPDSQIDSMSPRASASFERSPRMEEHEGEDEVLCFYTRSAKPVPIVASSGRDKHHYRNLDGEVSRPAIAQFLAYARSTQTLDYSHAAAQSSGVSDSRGGGTSPLLKLLPPQVPGVLAIVAPEFGYEPAYLIISAFEDRYSPYMDIERAFLEHTANLVAAAAARFRSQALDRAQMRLTQRMQHQLRTPLHTIVGVCESVSHLLTGDEESQKRMIASIALSAEALDSRLSDIFDLSLIAGLREQATRGSVLLPWTDLPSLFNLIANSANSAWRFYSLTNSSVNLDTNRIQVPPPPEMVIFSNSAWNESTTKFKFDCEALTRIVSKLVMNGLQATERGVVTVHVSVEQSQMESSQQSSSSSDHKRSQVLPNESALQELHLSVSDTGAGMSAVFLRDNVFQSFDRASEDPSGAGLSLSICSSVIARLGGRVHVSSKVGQGSTFNMVFPYPGPMVPRVETTHVKVAAVPTDDDEKARASFMSFCQDLCQQFGATVIGDAGKDRELLDQAHVIFVAGERLDSPENCRAVADLLLSHHGKGPENQIVIELPNRAFVDAPNSLKADRKERWIGKVPAFQIWRPLVVPDLDIMTEIFEEVAQGLQLHTAEFQHVVQVEPAEAGFIDETSPLVGIVQSGGRLNDHPEESSVISPQSAEATKSSSRADRRPVADKVLASDRETNHASAHTSQDGFKCLVVEDNPLNARILTTLLKRAGIPQLEARDGVEAVELFKEHLPQVVLLDINMPRMNGFEAALEMRKIACPHYPRIIAVTALSLESDKLKGAECQIDDWLTKPLRLAQLAKDIQAWRKDGVWAQDSQTKSGRRSSKGSHHHLHQEGYHPPETPEQKEQRERSTPSKEELARHTLDEPESHGTIQ